MAAQGHQGRFALASLSAGYEFRKETIAGTHGNERDAPIPAVRKERHRAAGFDPEQPFGSTVVSIVMARLAAVSDLAYVKQDDSSQARKWLRRTKHHW
jgi:hypothetical protein